MPLQQTSGNDTSDAYGGGAAIVPNYIEDVFSTYLTTGTGSSLIVNNGIDLAGKGGLVWQKGRNSVVGASSNTLFDTARGVNQLLQSNSTSAQISASGTLPSFNSNGFEIGSNNNLYVNGQTGVSWTFRKQAKFFDIVTYTGTGSATTIAHSLASTPGCIIVKRTDTTANWQVYHVGFGSPTVSAQLNLFNAPAAASTVWNSTAPTSSVFSVGTSTDVNASGGTYVAYLFANNAGGFGAAGTDNVITCGTVTGAGSTTYVPIALGYEPQWILTKKVSGGTSGWSLFDVMRGWTTTINLNESLLANTADPTDPGQFQPGSPSATGINFLGDSSVDYIYIAIRRGPMATPTDATKVFAPVINTGNDSATTITSNFPVDFAFRTTRNVGIGKSEWDRLRGSVVLETSTTSPESSNSSITFDNNTGINVTAGFNGAYNYVNWMFQRAPGFFDEVCYTGTGSYPLTVAHNLGVAPELIITKTRSSADGWYTYAKPLTSPNANWYQNYLTVNNTSASTGDTSSITTAPTSTTITYAGYYSASGVKYVNYLFATLAGVSKVGTYTGNGTTQTINCGFTGGARFVLIKRTDSTGDWYTYDTARGMTTLTDPYLFLNSTAAESATLGSVTTVTTGFAVNASILAAINTNGGTYVFLAIA
jgi:hypothetical protein